MMIKVIGPRDLPLYIKETEAEFNALNGMDQIRTYHDAECAEYNRCHCKWVLDIAKEEKKKGKK